MTVAPYFHIAISVNDIDKAMEDFSELFQIGFYPPTPIAPFFTHSGVQVNCRVAYSRGDPPNLELLEYLPESGPPLREGMNHIGLFSEELELHATDGWGLGLVPENLFRGDDGGLRIVMTRPDSFHGTRLEIFPESHRINTTAANAEAIWIERLSQLEQPPPS